MVYAQIYVLRQNYENDGLSNLNILLDENYCNDFFQMATHITYT